MCVHSRDPRSLTSICVDGQVGRSIPLFPNLMDSLLETLLLNEKLLNKNIFMNMARHGGSPF